MKYGHCISIPGYLVLNSFFSVVPIFLVCHGTFSSPIRTTSPSFLLLNHTNFFLSVSGYKIQLGVCRYVHRRTACSLIRFEELDSETIAFGGREVRHFPTKTCEGVRGWYIYENGLELRTASTYFKIVVISRRVSKAFPWTFFRQFFTDLTSLSQKSPYQAAHSTLFSK